MRYFTLFALLLLSNLAQADGLIDLKAALNRLQGQSNLKAALEAKTWRKLGEGSEAIEYQGHAHVQLEDVGRGLQVVYSKDLLAKMELEEHAKSKDANSKTPILSALREFEASQLREMTSAAGNLARQVEKAVFKSEKADTYQGKAVRLLNFELAADVLNERQRKYVKHFEGNLLIWIAADGTPLASRIINNVRGRAFIVIRFEAKSDEQSVYAQAGDRLLIVQKESKSSAAGAGERSEERVVKTLQVL